MKERLLRAGVPEEKASELQEEYDAMSADERTSRDEFLAGISDSDIRDWVEGLGRESGSDNEPVAADPVVAEDDAEAKAKAEAEAKEKAAAAVRHGSDR